MPPVYGALPGPYPFARDMSHQITVQPSRPPVQRRTDETPFLPPCQVRRRACPTAAGRRLRLLQSRCFEGVVHGAHQAKALSAEEEAAGSCPTCCARRRPIAGSRARHVPGAGEFPCCQAAHRVIAIERPATDVAPAAHAAAGQPEPTRRPVRGVHPASDPRAPQLQMANAPTQPDKPAIELHIRHMPRRQVHRPRFGAMKEKDILRMEALRQLLPARGQTSPSCCWPAAPVSPHQGPTSSVRHLGVPAPHGACTGAAAAADPT